MSRHQRIAEYSRILSGCAALGAEHLKAAKRKLAREDLFFLLVYVLGRVDINRDWLFERCCEVQAKPDGHLDLWAREHYKSTIITYGKTIQDILIDPNVTIGIFSHTRPIAKGFLRQIKREFEGNQTLRALFDDVIWDNPQKDAPKWSEDDGIILIRSQNPKEATVEAWGLVDGMPTGKHFAELIYDDVVTEKSVTGPEMIKKTTDAWALSLNLGAHGGLRRCIGTRYHFNDTYRTMIDRGSVIPRIHPATHNGKMDGDPVFLTLESLMEKRGDQGPYIFGCQMLQDPVADKAQGFDRDWVARWPGKDFDWMNIYILVDPASEKKRGSDYTTMQVIGLGEDSNYYWIDGIRDRLNLTERGAALMRLHRQYRPFGVGYEKYGIQADIEYIETIQGRENYRFSITPLGGSMPKADRIRRLVPVMETGRWYMPAKCAYRSVNDGEMVDVVHEFMMELEGFPVGSHDDLLDGAARVLDDTLGARFPIQKQDAYTYMPDPEPYNELQYGV